MERPPKIDDRNHRFYFESACKAAESDYAKDPPDVDNLIKWGDALIELTIYNDKRFADQKLEKISVLDSWKSLSSVPDIIMKFEKAIKIDPKNHYARWRLGRCAMVTLYDNPDPRKAKVCFDKAVLYFKQALAEDPQNESYIEALNAAYRAPEMHAKIHPYTIKVEESTMKKLNSNLKFGPLGLIVLAVGVVAWSQYVKYRAKS